MILIGLDKSLWYWECLIRYMETKVAIFDIFLRLPDGKPMWMESVQGLVKANKRLNELMIRAPRHYFIYSEMSGAVAGASVPRFAIHYVGSCSTVCLFTGVGRIPVVLD